MPSMHPISYFKALLTCGTLISAQCFELPKLDPRNSHYFVAAMGKHCRENRRRVSDVFNIIIYIWILDVVFKDASPHCGIRI